jgi:hypothetical protein
METTLQKPSVLDQERVSVNIKIGDLFKAISLLENHEFKQDHAHIQKEDIKIKDENNNWVNVNAFIQKKDEVWEVKFDNGLTLKAGSRHKLIYDKINSIFIENIFPGLEVILADNSVCRVVSCELIKELDKVYDLSVDTSTHLYQTSNGLIHHNSTVVKQSLDDMQLKEDQDYFILSGKATPVFLYKFLYDHSDKVIVLDDMDEVFKDNTGANILKAALDSKRVRKVTYGSSGLGEGYENSFTFTGKVVNISNMTLAEYPGAIVSRASGSIAEIDYTLDELIDFIKNHIAAGIVPEFEDKEFKTEVIDYILELSEKTKHPPVPRFVANLVNIAIANPGDYKLRIKNQFRLSIKAAASSRRRG